MASHDVFWRWIGWKSRQVYQFLNILKQATSKINPSLQFGLMLSEESVLNPLQSLMKQSQDLLEAKRQMFDYYVITAKLTDARDDLTHLSQIASRLHQLIGESEKVLLRVHIPGTSGADLRQALAAVAEFDPSLVSGSSALDHETKLESLEFLFRPR
jgi:hypothetical protein